MVCRLVAHPLCVVLLLAGVCPLELPAQSGKYDGLAVTNIRFDPVEQPLGPSELHDILPLRMNQPFRMSDVRASIERLFATGRYSDIQVDGQPYRGGVAVTFKTGNKWFVGDVVAAGRIPSPPNPGQLANVAGLNLGQPYTQAALDRAVEAQKRLLESNGLFRSHVSPVFDWDSSRDFQQVNIRFEIDGGPRARFTTPVLLGDLKADPNRVLAATRMQRWIINTWKPMTQSRMREALEGVRALYRKENRLEARVSLESVRYDPETNRVTPTLRIDAGPRIEVHTIGANISNKKLRQYVPIFEEHAVDHDLLAEGARNLRDYLQSRGYFESEVEFKQQRVINDRASIDYLVNTGKRHNLVKIEISGNRYFKSEVIRERMYLQTVSLLEFPHGRYSESLLRRDEDAIEGLYQSNGFRDVKVSHRIENGYEGKPGNIAVFLDIEEGPQYFVGDLQVEGIERLDKPSLLSMLSCAKGQPFSEYNVAVDRDTILNQYFEKGFPRATFEWSFKPSEDPHRLDLRFVVHEGQQQFVREVLITGNRVTRSALINRNITLNPGDPLSPTAMTDIQRRLYALGVFARVDTAIQSPDGDTDHKYVLYNVDEARRYSMAVGFGAELGLIGGCTDCLDQPGGAAAFSPRVSFDVARNNLWGLAHTLSLRTRVSTLDQRALLNYSWPFFTGNDNLTLSITGLYEDSHDIRTFSFRRQEGSVQLSQRFSKSLTLFYRYAYRRVAVGDVKITEFLIPQVTLPVRLGIGSLTLVQDRRDDPLDPHRGIYNTVDLGLAAHGFGSQRNFFRFLARNATYHGIGKRLVLARSTEFGNMYAFNYTGDLLEAIPLPERFFGGGTSLRGFNEAQAGPRDPSTGFPLGGTALLFNQTELRFPLIGENIGGVLFHDMGNVYSSIGNLSFRVHQRGLDDFDYMVHAVGFGVRYRTPIGPARADLGYSINPPYYFGLPKGTSLGDLIKLGPTPCSPAPGVPSICEQQRLTHFTFVFSIGQTF